MASMTKLEIPSPGRVLIADDDASARTALVELLREEGFTVRSAADGFKALGQVDDWTPDLIVTDVQMPGMDGIELMRKLRERFEGIGVVVMTAHGTVERAVAAMREGADDYLTKPVDVEELLMVMRRVLAAHELQRENARLKNALTGESIAAGVDWIGQSRASKELLGLVRQVADSEASVLVLGESGTGKELVARALHAWSRRNSGPFVAVHCAALNEGVLESELFGHEKGAFTGAAARRDGRFHKADGGTLFLDEVGDIPMAVQVKLLRVLQERELERVGSDETERVDVRVVAATHKDLPLEVREGRFREDLYYRLNVVNVELPPLRERGEDLLVIARYLLSRYAREYDVKVKGLSPNAAVAIRKHAWPGNIRELENRIKKAIVLCESSVIGPDDLGLTPDVLPQILTLADAKDRFQRDYINEVLALNNGNRTKTARDLGVDPRTVFRHLEKESDDDPAVAAAEAP